MTTARALAEDLGISERTVYRDVRDLVLSGVPVLGEAGVGYALPRGYDLPPLMFNEEEIEALVLGARVVQSWADPQLRAAAGDVLAKVEAVLPPALRERLSEASLFSPGVRVPRAVAAELGRLRTALRERRKIRFHYVDKGGAGSSRTIWPLGLFFWGKSWSVARPRARCATQSTPRWNCSRRGSSTSRAGRCATCSSITRTKGTIERWRCPPFPRGYRGSRP